MVILGASPQLFEPICACVDRYPLDVLTAIVEKGLASGDPPDGADHAAHRPQRSLNQLVVSSNLTWPTNPNSHLEQSRWLSSFGDPTMAPEWLR